ncbi:DUF2474 domain-containing protein [Roseateles violae]|uniref:DUF2474 domain-containing protein n=1 Tax=Roseateles violae TaxID=3058042 RepID=A0ABT8DWV5_9BURK|nr:DUF2474 domain-containing protein [Pelomonas sp. PFR6]MDN3921469.1 DUF2474 domain-containing protein [Pelomonas sp. PFR6]
MSAHRLWLRRVAWLMAIWLLSVTALGLAALGMRLLMRQMGLS